MSFDRTSYIAEPGPIEPELKIIFSRKAPLTIFEIGACEGEDSIKYARLFPNASIFAFEPLPGNIELIKNNFLRHGIKNATWYNKALSDKNGDATFYVSSGRPPQAMESDWDYGNKSSSLLPPARHLETASFISFSEKINVETITLKSFCIEKNIGLVDLIHMDVQGAELLVLKGAGNFIKSVKLIWLEVSKIDLYKDQPLEPNIRKFMVENEFVLIKNALYGVQGDQLYISKNFYSAYKIFLIASLIRLKYIVKRILQKTGLGK